MSQFADKVRQTWSENILFSVLLELTYACNLDCSFCYNDKSLAGKALSTEQYLALLDELRELGVMNLILSGGEPLAHPDFFQIGARARELGFVVRIKSNGHALNTTMARRVRDEIDPFEIEISLHGATAPTHDRQTQVPGSFERLMKNLETLKQLGIRFKLNSAVTRWNQDELGAMTELALALGVGLKFDTHLSPKDDGDTTPLALAASSDALTQLFSNQPGKINATPEAAPGKYCGAGAATLAIDPFGTVYPCVQWRQPVGNLHQSSIRELWHNNPGLEAIRQANAATAALPQAAQLRQSGFCPGAAYQQTGSANGVYPSVDLQMGLRHKLVAANLSNNPSTG